MAERTKAPVLKTGDGKPSVGSNPTPSATCFDERPCYVYVLKSLKNDQLYIASTEEPDARFVVHNAGRVRSTKARRPWKCLLVEEYPDRKAAEKRERYLKSGWGRSWLKANVLKGPGLAT